MGLPPTASLSPSCRLKPFTSYKFRVKATNDIGDSEYSEESESLTTLQAGPCPEGPGTVPWASPEPHHPLLPHSPRGGPHHPLRHPAHHHVGAHPLAGTVPSAPFGDPPGGGTEGWPCQPGPWGLSKAGDRGCAGPNHPEEAGDGNLGVPQLREPPPHPLLQPPAEDKINGILLGFRLRYRELLYDSLRGFTLRGIGNPGATWAELTRESSWSHGGRGDTGLGGGTAGGVRGQGSVLRPALTPASCAPLPGASPELSRLSCAPWSRHHPLCVTVPFVSPSPLVSPSLSVPNALVCAGAGSVPLCSARSVPAAGASPCAHLTRGGSDVPAVSVRAAVPKP